MQAQEQLPGLDLDRFTPWFRATVPGVGSKLTASLITGGESNLTYEVSDGQQTWIVCRPPLGHVLATAPDMGREFRVMSALQNTDVPVPTTYALCQDTSVLGAPFYVMERMAGTPYRQAGELARLGPERTRAISERLVDTLTALHAVEPARVGLGDFGRPEGYLARQVGRWKKQLDASYCRDLPAAEELHALLAADVPPESAARIVHGDYRLDNVLVDAEDRATAVLDWEMTTLGDPLADLGLLLVHHRLGDTPGTGSVTDAASAPGFLDEGEIIDRYAAGSERDLSRFGFYLGLAAYKLAAILEGVHFRHLHGQTVGKGFVNIGSAIHPCSTPGSAHSRRTTMDFQFDAKTKDLQATLLAFMDSHVYPAEATFREQIGQVADRWAWDSVPVLAELRAEARKRGLWNLFLPGDHGDGLTNLQYAPLAEITGRSGHLAPAVLNCAAPDTGNMEVLHMFGTAEQKKEWLEPLLEGEIRSAFAMTEPDVASSDATNISTSIVRDGDEYVVNGRKWWITGAMNPNCKIFIVMGKTDPTADRHKQQSMILVPRDTPGLEIRRGMEVLGYDDHEHGGHAEMSFTDVRVPAPNLISGEGQGFAISQARLGPGRLHHCMRSIGVAERAIELMCERAEGRVAFGKPLSDQGVIRDWIAESRVRIEQLRLLALKTAWLMDTVGNKGAHTEIQAIKIAAPSTVQWILDKAIQVHGAGGLSQDYPLAAMYASNRTLRFADGPDEVHKNALARNELRRQATARAGR